MNSINLKKTLLAAILIAAAVFALSCDKKKESSDSSQVSSSQQEESSESSASSFDTVLPAPKVDEADFNYTKIIPQQTGKITVTKELIYKMFDYFAQGYTLVVPDDDFDSPEDLDSDMLVRLGIAMTQPLRVAGEGNYVLYTYDGFDIQAAVYKYLGLQVPSFLTVRMYDYSPEQNVFYINDPIPTFLNYLKLSSLEADSDGVYTARFDVYRAITANADAFENDFNKHRTDIVESSSPDADIYTHTGVCTLKYIVMEDENGEEFFRYISKSVEK